ncbi:uncharacterized protein DUF429 [Solirubrobacter pauli]|uniref:Uncharacterized protein DUF429 n=1 Tax=Solirubrobacter pauli TaxID=166793 RepID=A0A660L735_9ACTN|nr:uncharacterized protein DUF429 [Solirubrobacter pauli]
MAGAPKDSYKGNSQTAHDRREHLLAGLLTGLGSAFAISPDQRQACIDSDDCLDALVCALLARAVQQHDTLQPEPGEQHHLAQTEGWIHLPTGAHLDRLVAG